MFEQRHCHYYLRVRRILRSKRSSCLRTEKALYSERPPFLLIVCQGIMVRRKHIRLGQSARSTQRALLVTAQYESPLHPSIPPSFWDRRVNGELWIPILHPCIDEVAARNISFSQVDVRFSVRGSDKLCPISGLRLLTLPVWLFVNF